MAENLKIFFSVGSLNSVSSYFATGKYLVKISDKVVSTILVLSTHLTPSLAYNRFHVFSSPQIMQSKAHFLSSIDHSW